MSWHGPKIEDHGIIGDLHTTALVGCDGGINFLCFPEFDSPTVFAGLLDPERGGCFRIAPAREDYVHQQLYLPDTTILLTRFLGEEGIVELTDFMPVEESGPLHNIIRMVRCIRGDVTLVLECSPRFDYARVAHRVHRGSDCVLFTPEKSGLAALKLHIPVAYEVTPDGAVRATLRLRAGEQLTFVLEEALDGESPARHPDFAHKAFDDTVQFWRRWVARSRYRGRWREMVNRSALTLKLMTSQPHGSIIAAPTLGLPEAPGGARNWDYRFTWIRDASLCLREFMELGHLDEAEAFMKWLAQRIQESDDGGLAPCYRLDGRRVAEEEHLDLRGYMDSKPVRVGNDAGKQLQLDLYGPLFDAVRMYELAGGTIAYDLWNRLKKLIHWLGDNWHRPDDGIWEVRGARQHFVHSRVMSWLAFERAHRIAQSHSLPAPLEDWRRARDAIYEDIHQGFWSDELRSFVQRKGVDAVDASVLLMPQVGFIGGTDPRWTATMRQIEERLVEDALVWRYRQSDGTDDPDPFPADEGSFTICSFWLVECLARAGRLGAARLFFEKVIGYSNHLGLYAEQLGRRGEHLGNFPQAFTHIGLITAAMDIDRQLSDAGWGY